MKTQNLNIHITSQGLLIDKLNEIIDWMKVYEIKRHTENNQRQVDSSLSQKVLSLTEQTQKITTSGICYGLSAYLADIIIFEEKNKNSSEVRAIERPQEDIPRTINEFVEEIKNITLTDLATIITPNDQWLFYSKMNTFIHKIMQLHNIQENHDNLLEKGASGLLAGILNLTSPSNNQKKLLGVHIFTDANTINEWINVSKPGDALNLISLSHSMLLFCNSNEEGGEEKIGFYDPDKDEIIYGLKNDLCNIVMALNNMFNENLYHSTYNKPYDKEHTIVIGFHIVDADRGRKTINLPQLNLSEKQIKLFPGLVVKLGDYSTIQKMLDLHALNYPCIFEMAIKSAITYKDITMVKFLITTEGHLIKKDAANDPYGILSYALDFGTPSIIKLLIEEFELDTNKLDTTFNPCLYYTIRNGDREGSNMLIEKGANIHITLPWGTDAPYRTLLHTFINIKDTKSAKMLLDLGFNCKYYEKEGIKINFLLVALRYYCPEMIEMLIEKGEDVNQKNKDGFAPLHYAACTNNIDLAKLLIKNGAAIDIITNQGLKAIDCASLCNNTEVLNFFSQFNLADNESSVSLLAETSESNS